MSDRYALRLGLVNANTVKAQNVGFLATAFTPARSDSVVRITVQVSSAVTVRLVPSSGTALLLNGGAALTAGVPITATLPLDPERSWNVSTPNAAGTTVQFLSVVELSRIL